MVCVIVIVEGIFGFAPGENTYGEPSNSAACCVRIITKDCEPTLAWTRPAWINLNLQEDASQ